MANFTAQAIKASFIKLLNEKPLNKISVRDIVEDCGINRNSFYYHYQDIPALLSEIIMEQTDAIIKEYPSITSLDECFHAVFELAQKNRQVMMHIYESANSQIFTVNAMQHCERVVTAYIRTAFPEITIAEADERAVIRFLKCQLYGLVIDWISNGMKDEAFDDVHRLIEMIQELPALIVAKSMEDNLRKKKS